MHDYHTIGVEADGSIPAGCFGKRQKEILKGISVYFNPGEMIGVMGPSGSGKTTFLDLLTGRRKAGVDGVSVGTEGRAGHDILIVHTSFYNHAFHSVQGSIYVNGVPIDEIRDWYIANTGYVLQLATPYYSELTVRENLTLAAMMKLPDDFPLSKKFRRVEQVMVVVSFVELFPQQPVAVFYSPPSASLPLTFLPHSFDPPPLSPPSPLPPPPPYLPPCSVLFSDWTLQAC